MHAKVLALLGCVREGFVVAGVDNQLQGGVRIRLRRGADCRELRFAHYEVPAVLQECTSIGVAK